MSIKYSEVGFRAFYHNFIAVPIKDDLKAVVQDFHGADKANYILTYGYIDHIAGLTLEVLATASRHDESLFLELETQKYHQRLELDLLWTMNVFILMMKTGKCMNDMQTR